MSGAEGGGPAAGRPQPPELRTVVPFVCEAGVTPCGAEARLYPAGWLCAEHAPRSTKTS